MRRPMPWLDGQGTPAGTLPHGWSGRQANHDPNTLPKLKTMAKEVPVGAEHAA